MASKAAVSNITPMLLREVGGSAILLRFRTDCRVGVWATAITLTITLHNASPVKIEFGVKLDIPLISLMTKLPHNSIKYLADNVNSIY